MRKLTAILVFLACIQAGFAQKIADYKKKTPQNEKERTLLLDILRASLYQQYKQEFIFVVNHLKVSQNYAWFMGDAKRKDGKHIVLDENEINDCCHVEALLKKSNGKWYIVESVAFSTDVWYDGIDKNYPDAPKAIFPFHTH